MEGTTRRHSFTNAQIVSNIKIYHHLPQDYWFWLPNNDGQFNIKSAWNQIRCKYSEFNRTTVIRDKFCAPKMSICSLLAKLNKLNTKDIISKWNPDIDHTCVLWLQQFEERNHLFFQCAYSKNLLKEITQKLQVGFGNSYDLSQILEYICQN